MNTLFVYFLFVGAALAQADQTWVTVYRNAKQSCNSSINLDLPTDKAYYQLNVLVENNDVTKNMDFYLWGNLKLEKWQTSNGQQNKYSIYSDCAYGEDMGYYDSSKCIDFVPNYISWDEARTICSTKYDGMLKDVLNEKDTLYLGKYSGNTEYWIGLREIWTNESVFAWDRGLNNAMQSYKLSDYNLWPNGQLPTIDKTKKCVAMANSTWFLDDCASKKVFICQRASQALAVGKYRFLPSNCVGDTYNVKIQVSPDTSPELP
uniref:C-type lectin domain-containing protein n=1 Tax=Acrobeloides nanus TaxID=290746 RepID=A0A914E302_9BILA